MDTILRTEPVAGPRFKAAASLPIEGGKRRKLLCLIAAYEDGGGQPSVRQLAERMGCPPTAERGERQRHIKHVDALLRALVRDGWLRLERKHGERNRYTILREKRGEPLR